MADRPLDPLVMWHDRALEAAYRIADNDGRLSTDSSADLDLAHDQFQEALDAYADVVMSRRYHRTSEVVAQLP